MIPVVITLLFLHAPDGREVFINPDSITSIYKAKPDEANKLVHEEAKCVIMMADGKHIAVVEDCEAIRKQAEGRLW